MADEKGVADVLEQALRAVQPPDLQAINDKANEERESLYIEHSKYIAIFEISPGEVPLIDAIPGHFRVQAIDGDEQFGIDDEGKPIKSRTKEGAIRTHVYPLRLHITPGAKKGGEYIITTAKEWLAKSPQAGSMMSPMTEAASLMARAGGTGDEV